MAVAADAAADAVVAAADAAVEAVAAAGTAIDATQWRKWNATSRECRGGLSPKIEREWFAVPLWLVGRLAFLFDDRPDPLHIEIGDGFSNQLLDESDQLDWACV